VAGFPATAWPEASALGGRTCTSSARPRPHAPLPPGRLRSGLGRALRSTARRHQPGPRLRPPASQSHIFGRRTRQHQHRTLSSSQELADHSPLRSGKEAALGQARSAGQPGTRYCIEHVLGNPTAGRHSLLPARSDASAGQLIDEMLEQVALVRVEGGMVLSAAANIAVGLMYEQHLCLGARGELGRRRTQPFHAGAVADRDGDPLNMSTLPPWRRPAPLHRGPGAALRPGRCRRSS